MSESRPRHIALQFGHIKHFNEGLGEVSRQLALQFASRAADLKTELGWHFHFILADKWHGMFGNDVSYHRLTDRMRWPHRFPVDLDAWHGLHQHMRYRPPLNSRCNIITVHDLNQLYAKKGLSLWWQNLRLKAHLLRAHKLVAISRYTADDLARAMPDLPRAQVIYNGVADLGAQHQTAVGALEDKTYVLHLSRMSASKNVGSILGLAAHWPDMHFALAGPEGPDVDGHRHAVLQAGLKNVSFHTNVSETEKAWLYAHCAAFLFPSWMEGFGLPPIEALRFGKPVIISNRTSLPEVCGPCAALLPDFAPATMKHVVLSAIERHRLSDDAARQAIRALLERYSWPHAAAAYMDCYASR